MDRNKAPDALLAVAEAAQDVAAGLHKFLSPVSDSGVEITALISKCFAVSSSLRSLAVAVQDSRRLSLFNRVSGEVEDVAKSLDHTFKDLHQIVGEGFEDARKARLPMSAAYRKVWRNINDHFQRESGNQLVRRLDYCRLLLNDLCDILQDGSPRDPGSFNDLAERVSKLLDVQMARLRPEIDWLQPEPPLSPGSSKKQPSFERERPNPAQAGSGSQQKKRPAKPDRHSSSASNRNRKQQPPPPAPEVPRSDTSSRDDRSNVSSNMTENSVSHWLPKVFERSPPSTKLPETGQPSGCLDEHNPDALDYLDDDYIRLNRLSFESGDLFVSFHIKPRDGRARILCETMRPRIKDCTQYLTNLDIEREGSFLKLCRVNSSQRRSSLWAVLRFASYETLVLFFCTFLALRSQDNGRPIRLIDDWRLGREEEVFRCVIQDDQFNHQLTVWREKESGGVRLQASVLKGEMKKMPVWTAFITHQIHSPRWMKRSGDRTVLLNDLYRYVFDSEYTAPIAPGGEHDLTFKHSEDADEFMDHMEDLVERAHEEDPRQ